MKKNKKLSPIRLLSLGYLTSVLLGTLLLLLPFSAKDGQTTTFIDALFTATSATCVTGLIPYDTFTHWTRFGQVVIIVLIQIGGLGFMTIISLFLTLIKRSIGLYNRTVLMQSAGSYNISEVTVLLKRIVVGTLLFEGIGAIVLTLEFLGEKTVGEAIFYGVFHSISAFCNAGFDVFGFAGGSLTGFSSNYVVLITLMVLIMVGGSGFIVWSDLIDTKFKWKKFQLHTKIVIVYNLVLTLVPALIFFLVEFTTFGQKGNFINLPFGEKILNSFFLAVSPRTAGFNSVDLNELTSSGKLLTMILMFIGGNPGSTAGGVKVTTIVVVLANLVASAKNKEHVVIFKRRISNSIIRQASSLFLAYAVMVIASTVIITSFETFSLEQVVFEVISAVGTVGLTLGVSAEAGVLTKLILAFLMYAGRLGALTLFGAIMQDKEKKTLIEPQGRLLVG